MNNRFSSFADIPISEGKSLKDLLTFHGKDYWWYNDTNIYEDLLKRNLDEFNRFKAIHFFVAKHFKFFLCIVDIITYILILVVELFSPKKHSAVSNNNTKPLALLKTSARRWVIEQDPTSHEYKVNSMYYDEIIENINNKLSIITLFTDIPTIFTFKRYLKVKMHYLYPSLALTRYWSWNVWVEEKNATIYFKGVFDKIKNNDDWWVQASELTGLPSSDLKKILEYHLYCTFPLCVRHNILMENVVKRENPSVMILTGEQAYMGRGWIYVGKKYQIPVIGLQHGVIHPDDPGYMMHDRYTDMEINSQHPFPLPDLTLVWGQKDYELLVNIAGYPEDKIIVTGNPRNDRLAVHSDSDIKERIFAEYNIPKSHKMILWTTQSHANTKNENDLYFSEVFSAVSQIDNITLIVKPHPHEGDLAEKLVKKYSIQYDRVNVHVAANSNDTTAMIMACDLLLIKNSTTGQEAVALQKPLVVLDFSDEFDKGHYVEEGVAIGVTEENKLTDTLNTLFNDDSLLKSSRDAYIKKYMYKIDGLSAKRCADIIQSLIKNKI